MKNPPEWRRVLALSEITNGNFKCIEFDGVKLLICRLYGEAYALVNNCPHQNLPMDKASMFEYEIVCPHHNACFDVRDGSRRSGPSVYPLAGYPCRVVAREVEIDVANPETSMDRYLSALSAVKKS